MVFKSKKNKSIMEQIPVAYSSSIFQEKSFIEKIDFVNRSFESLFQLGYNDSVSKSYANIINALIKYEDKKYTIEVNGLTK
jgi:hypothetical protein